jgi:hypothetical protein
VLGSSKNAADSWFPLVRQINLELADIPAICAEAAMARLSFVKGQSVV